MRLLSLSKTMTMKKQMKRAWDWLVAAMLVAAVVINVVYVIAGGLMGMDVGESVVVAMLLLIYIELRGV